MIFAWPLAVLGLLAAPALAALYFLRQRSRRRRVSSLLLWRGEPPRRDAGRRPERFAAPLPFWLELAAILLLVTAAAGPHLLTPDSRRPLVAVLDDSYSMRAGGAASPRAAAAAALLEELGSGRHSAVTLVLAGERPQLLSADLETAEVAAALHGWGAAAPSADLEGAVALALELAGERARVLVASDRAPRAAAEVEGLAWRAFGRARGNLAVVHAVRGGADAGGRDEGDHCLLEIANFSDEAAETTLGVRYEGASATDRPLRLAASSTATVRLPVPAGAAVELELAGDELAIDDRVVLLPETARPVRVANGLRDGTLRDLVGATLAATGRVRTVTDDAELVVHDRPEAAGDAVWTVSVLGGAGSVPYLGPFVLDLGHPLAEGLSLSGVIWAAPPWPENAAAAVVSAGDVPLVVDRERSGARRDGAHHVTLRFHAALSNLQRTPNWPILWWNLLEWRAASAPGLRRHNVRLGETVTVALAPGDDELRWRPPGGVEVALPALAPGRVEMRAGAVGVHEVAHGAGVERFAVNALAAAESDLRQAASGRWGGWEEPGGERWAERPVGWVFVLAAAALMLAHLYVADGRRRTP